MNHLQLNRRLCKRSPFVLKTKTNGSDRVSFNWSQLTFNQEVIGCYGIEENDDYINIMVHTEDDKITEPFVVVLDYDEKPILLTCAKQAGAPLNKALLADNLLKLVPEQEYIAPEQLN